MSNIYIYIALLSLTFWICYLIVQLHKIKGRVQQATARNKAICFECADDRDEAANIILRGATFWRGVCSVCKKNTEVCDISGYTGREQKESSLSRHYTSDGHRLH